MDSLAVITLCFSTVSVLENCLGEVIVDSLQRMPTEVLLMTTPWHLDSLTVSFLDMKFVHTEMWQCFHIYSNCPVSTTEVFFCLMCSDSNKVLIWSSDSGLQASTSSIVALFAAGCFHHRRSQLYGLYILCTAGGLCDLAVWDQFVHLNCEKLSCCCVWVFWCVFVFTWSFYSQFVRRYLHCSFLLAIWG